MVFDLFREVVANFAVTVVSTGGGTTSTNRIMNARMSAQKTLTVGLPMATAIAAREVDDETTMATATTACNVGFVEISKTNFMPEAQATAGGVNADIDRWEASSRREQGSTGIIDLFGRGIF